MATDQVHRTSLSDFNVEFSYFAASSANRSKCSRRRSPGSSVRVSATIHDHDWTPSEDKLSKSSWSKTKSRPLISSATAAADACELSLAVTPDVGAEAIAAAMGCAVPRSSRLLASFDFHILNL